MSRFFIFSVVVLLQLSLSVTLEDEPLCLSKYDYDYKVLRKLVELEQNLLKVEEIISKQEDNIRKQEQALEKYRKETTNTFENRLSSLEAVTVTNDHHKSFESGSTYVRWGRGDCPGNGTETVYSGYAGGSSYDISGAAVNYLCLPTDPLWGQFTDSDDVGGYVYGAEYQITNSISKKLLGTSVYDNDVPCAVCRSTRASSIMVPGRNACYDSWTLEYSGYLFSGHRSHAAATEYVCLDKNPEAVTGSTSNHNGKLFYQTRAKCGSLKCPPYVQNRELTCSVCTK